MDESTPTLTRPPTDGAARESVAARASGRPSASDEEIVARVRDGETILFEHLIRRYNQRLYRVAARSCATSRRPRT